MNANFLRALALVLVHEGGYSNNSADPGGATMRGVIQRVYDAYRQRAGLTTRSVKQLTDDELREIYRTRYWDKVDGDELPAGLDYCVFDAGVNSGVFQAIKWLQRAINDVAGKTLVVDGALGPITLAAAENTQSINMVIDKMCDRRLAMLKGLRTWDVFGKGWAARVSEVRAKAKDF